jgi:hypothetical protein
MHKKSHRRSKVSLDITDELITQLLQIGKVRSVSVRQQIRDAIYIIASARDNSPTINALKKVDLRSE